MSIRGTFFYSFKNLFKLPGRPGTGGRMSGAYLGIVFCIAVVIIVLQVVSGMMEGITARNLELLSNHVTVEPNFYYGTDEKKFEEVKTKIEDLEHVRSVSTFSDAGFGLLNRRGKLHGVQIKGVESNLYENDLGFAKYFEIVDGKFDLTKRDYILISKAVAQDTGIAIGDYVSLVLVTDNGKSQSAMNVNFMVQGVYDTGYYQIDKHSVYINLEKALELKPDGIKKIGIKIEDYSENTMDVVDRIYNITGYRWIITDWYTANSREYEEFSRVKMYLNLITVLIIFVGIINILTSLNMIVMEKKEEIAILKSSGVSPSTIMQSYLIIGIVVGSLAAFSGIVIGVFLSININSLFDILDGFLRFFQNIAMWMVGIEDFDPVTIFDRSFYLTEIPIKIELVQILPIFFGTVLLSAIFSIYPAYKASVIKPLEITQKF
ncbi:MAG: ABC transporter permease [Spirochaetales bacterium]|nr:ABC transporter permease [Spirochaetales bacterium]